MFVGLSTAAYFLDFPRLFAYGVLAGISPIVGEWLYRNVGASHHGFPMAFGAASLFMMLVGLSLFVRFMRIAPPPREEGGEVVL
jgi:hypothetical protein